MYRSELWVQAEAAVQAQLNLDVLEEAAGLAEAEICDLTLGGLLEDSIGLIISVRVGGEVVRGELTAAGPLGAWIRIGEHTVIRRAAIAQVTGLARVCAAHTPSGRHGTMGGSGASWLRNQIGFRIHVSSAGSPITGVLAEIGSDFLTLIVHGASEVIALGAIDLVKVLH